MSDRSKQNILFLLLLGGQFVAIKLISGLPGDLWWKSPVGYYTFLGVNVFASSFLVPSSWHFVRRLVRFASLQYFVLAVISVLSGWNSKETLQEVISSPGFYLFVLLPVPFVWLYKD